MDTKFFPLQDGPVEHPLCETDYFRRLDLLCTGCGLACRGSYVTALEKKYHNGCFKCQTDACNRVFGGADSNYEHEDGVYCREHYSEYHARRCTKCKDSILVQFVEVGRNNYCYPECYGLDR